MSADFTALFADAQVRLERRRDGTLLLQSPYALGEYPPRLGDHLLEWARKSPDTPFLLERAADGTWHGLTYAQAVSEVSRVAGWLLAHASQTRPIAILSENSVEHALLMLAGMHVGIPAMSISPAYSLVSRDFEKLKSIIGRTNPSIIFVDDHLRYARALEVLAPLDIEGLLVGRATGVAPEGARRLDQLRSRAPKAQIDRAFEAVGPDTVAKILFTSGSTDEPKGVITTQRMLCSNQQAKAQVWPFLERSPPILVDWLPWSHTFGGSHNFNLILRNGGTLYIDAGRPVPGLFSRTIESLREIAPSLYFNVPRGYELLIHALKSDPSLRARFFERLELIFYAAAALPRPLWDELEDISRSATGRSIPIVSAWGSTETAPLATECHFQADGPGNIGLPVPGCELKLVPSGSKLEVRVKGPHVTPGYWGRPDLTSKHFDEEGFYLIGDAVRFAAEHEPRRGLMFDGRLSEDFKLSTGTWVNVTELRLRAIAALAPIAQDVVVAGHDRSTIGLLIFPNMEACRSMDAGIGPSVRRRILDGLSALRHEAAASSTHAACALVLTEPPSIDQGEITDKGYINQRAVLQRRAEAVARLFAADDPDVIKLPSV